MYTGFYGLREKPFAMAPHAAFFYESDSHSAAISVLEYALQEGHGLTLMTGQSGSGKTLLIEYMLENTRAPISGVQLSHAGGSAEDMLELILMAFGVAAEADSFALRMEALKKHAAQMVQDGVSPVLFFDEAQQLTRPQLEQVRMFTNLHESGRYLLQVILVGQPEIRDVLARPEFRPMAQRIAVSHDLAPINTPEIASFIRHRLQKAGAARPDLFSEDALDLIARHSAGLPRKVNMLCDAALVTGYAEGESQITGACVDAVLRKWESPAFGLGAGSNGFSPGAEPPEQKVSGYPGHRGFSEAAATGEAEAAAKARGKAEPAESKAAPRDRLRRLKNGGRPAVNPVAASTARNGENGFLKKVRANQAKQHAAAPTAEKETFAYPEHAAGKPARTQAGKGGIALMVIGACVVAAQVGLVLFLF